MSITLNVLKDLVPKSQRTMVTEELVATLNDWNTDPKLMESFKDNVLSYISVLKDGRFKITDYMNAVRYVSYKLMGYTDIDAYAIAFPDRYDKLANEGLDRDAMSPYVSAYKKNMLVVKIFEQTIVPSHVLNAPMHQEALNIAMKIAINGRSEVARVNACNTILANTKPPETSKIELDVKIDQGSIIDDYEQAMNAMVAQQKVLIEQGGDLKAITNASIKRPEVIEAEID